MFLEEISSYWDTRAEGYSMSIHNQLESGTGKYYQDLFEQAKPNGDNLNCLDIGCGPGFFSILLSMAGHNVTSVDYSKQMLENARMNLKEFGYTPNVIHGDAQNLLFDDESFDFIVSRDLVWNLENPSQAYKEWVRILKPGGKIFIADGNYYLHYYDEDYRLAEEQYNKKQHECYGVDPTVINDIAKSLPLSKQLRPQWDQNELTGLGISNIHIKPNEYTLVSPLTNEKKVIITNFALWGEK